MRPRHSTPTGNTNGQLASEHLGWYNEPRGGKVSSQTLVSIKHVTLTFKAESLPVDLQRTR